MAAPAKAAVPIDSAELTRRRDALTQARASLALEGLTLSPDSLADMERYVAGELSHDELMARLDAKYRR